MYLVNGRTRGDIPGKITCVQNNGCSTVDYAIASTGLKNRIKYFNVTPLDGYSDHALIKTGIQIPIVKSEELQNNLLPLPCKYIWNNSKEKFLGTFNTNLVKTEIKSVMERKFTNSTEGINLLCKNVTTVYQQAANIGLVKDKVNYKGI